MKLPSDGVHNMASMANSDKESLTIPVRIVVGTDEIVKMTGLEQGSLYPD